MYWENKPGAKRSPYLDLCFDTVRRNAGRTTIHLLDERTVFDWLPLDPDVWIRLGTPEKRSDYARTRLVHRYGGLWLDFDVIAMAPLEELFEPLREYELAGWGRELGGRFYSNLFAARAGASMLAEWIDEQDEVLNRSEDWSTLSWGALVQEIIRPIAQRSSYYVYPINRIAPVPWYQWRRLLSRWQSPNDIMKHAPLTVMLWNKPMGPHLKNVPATAIREGRSLLSRLVRIAGGESTVERETDIFTSLHAISDLRFTRVGRSIEIRMRRLSGRA